MNVNEKKKKKNFIRFREWCIRADHEYLFKSLCEFPS